MDFTKILAAGFVVLLAAGGVAASGTGSSGDVPTSDAGAVTNADVTATYENGTVTLTLVDTDGDGGSEGIANATVDVKREYRGGHDARAGDEGTYEMDERVGTTDSNGTVVFDLTPENASQDVTVFEVSLTKSVFSAELEYRVENGSLSLIEEEYDYERATYREDDTDTTQHSDDERLSVSMADARATADSALEEPPEGNWRLVEADAHEEDNYYEFEYVLVGADRPGEAEIRVHGSSGDVIEYEQEIEHREEEDDRDDERDDERDERDDDRDDERDDDRDDDRDDERDDDDRDDERDDDERDDDRDEDRDDDRDEDRDDD